MRQSSHARKHVSIRRSLPWPELFVGLFNLEGFALAAGQMAGGHGAG
jgi:hypothetical protein